MRRARILQTYICTSSNERRLTSSNGRCSQLRVICIVSRGYTRVEIGVCDGVVAGASWQLGSTECVEWMDGLEALATLARVLTSVPAEIVPAEIVPTKYPAKKGTAERFSSQLRC